MAQPEVRLRWVRNIATGKVTCQSSNKTRELLKLGGYAEVAPPDNATPALPPLKTSAPAHRDANVKAYLWFAVGFTLIVLLGLGAFGLRLKGII